jgi:hypothetical protein
VQRRRPSPIGIKTHFSRAEVSLVTPQCAHNALPDSGRTSEHDA